MRAKSRSGSAIVALLALVLTCATLSAQPLSSITLTVTLQNAEGNPVTNANVTIHAALSSQTSTSDPKGQAHFASLEPGPYQVSIQAEHFQELTTDVIITTGLDARIDATLTAIHAESITVESDNDLPLERATSVPDTLHRDQVKDLPTRPATVSDVLPLSPGILRLPSGELNLSGTGEHRSALLVNSADSTDPATGQFGATVPIDSIRVIDVLSSPFLAQYGGFTSKVVAVETRKAGDKWNFELNDPLPEFRFRSWHMDGLETATPRIFFGGPVIPQKLYFTQSAQYEVRDTSVITLPYPGNQQRREGINSFSEIDYTISPTNFLTATVHVADQHTKYATLDYFDPEPVSPNSSNSTYSAAVVDHVSLGQFLLASGITVATFRFGVWPQGNLAMELSPRGNTGNYFDQQTRSASRAEWQETYSFSKHVAGTHDVKVGSSLGWTSERALIESHPVNINEASGALAETIRFTPGTPIQRADFEMAAFVQDHWSIGSRFALELGVRGEQQRITDTLRIGPRAGFSWTPFGSGHTVVRAGMGVFYDRVPLNVYGFPSYPRQILTLYGPGGETLNGPTEYLNLTDSAAQSNLPFLYAEKHPGNFSPYSRNWSAQVEQILSPRVRLRAGYLQSQSNGLVILNSQIDKNQNAFVLSGTGSSAFRQIELTGAFRAWDSGDLYFSFVRSSATGNLNEFSNYLANFPPAVIVPDANTNLPGDIPNRLLAWGTFRFPDQFRITPKMEYRSGLPYSSVDVLQRYVGVPDQARFPTYLSIDARVSKDLRLNDKYSIRLSVSGSNLTNHFNPISTHANTADPYYGTFFGEYRRRYTADFDFLF